MRHRLFTFLVPLVLLGILMGGAIHIQHELIYKRQVEYQRFRDTLYLPNANFVKLISLGYDNFMADYLWLRMIQSFAAGWSRPENAEQMKSYFDVITDLNPGFTDIYSFTIMAVGEQGKRSDMVEAVVDKAMLKVPHDYRIPYEGAFYAFWNMKDPALAKYYVRMARTDPDYPDFLDRWEGFLDLKQGRYRAAYEKFLGDFLIAVKANNTALYSINEGKLIGAVNEWFASEIQQRAVAWRETHGVYPSVEQLIEAGTFQGVELPNWQYVNAYLNQARSGQIEYSTDRQELQKFIETTVGSWDTLPVAPFDLLKPSYPGFVIWAGLEPVEDVVFATSAEALGTKFVLSRVEALHKTRNFLMEFNSRLQGYMKQNNGAMPTSLADIVPRLDKTPEPFGGQWVLDREHGRVYSSTFPRLADMPLPQIP